MEWVELLLVMQLQNILKLGWFLNLNITKNYGIKNFGKEFEKQRLARKILERIDNNTIDKIFDAITPEILSEIFR